MSGKIIRNVMLWLFSLTLVAATVWAALIKCPECSQQISDKSEKCPHCGVPAAQFSGSSGGKSAGGNTKLSQDGGEEFSDLAEEAVVRRKKGDAKELLAVLQKMEKLAPEHPAVWYGYGELYGSENSLFDKDKSIEAFRKFLKLAKDEKYKQQRLAVREFISDLEAGKFLQAVADPALEKQKRWVGVWRWEEGNKFRQLNISRTGDGVFSVQLDQYSNYAFEFDGTNDSPKGEDLKEYKYRFSDDFSKLSISHSHIVEGKEYKYEHLFYFTNTGIKDKRNRQLERIADK